ncbi:hypothetical protein P4O66_015059, partial [Electrophorus voltai]
MCSSTGVDFTSPRLETNVHQHWCGLHISETGNWRLRLMCTSTGVDFTSLRWMNGCDIARRYGKRLISEFNMLWHSIRKWWIDIEEKHQYTILETGYGYLCEISINPASRSKSCSKLGPNYIGPFEVNKRVNDITYQLNLPAHYHISRSFHLSLLKPVISGPLDELSLDDIPPHPIDYDEFHAQFPDKLAPRPWDRPLSGDSWPGLASSTPVVGHYGHPHASAVPDSLAE